VSIGEGLAQARREAGLSLAQISQRTRIREKIIADIENDDYSACGGDFYARGHIRSIARAIGTDPDPFIREYDASQQELDEFAEAEITQPGMAIGGQPGIPRRTDPGPPGAAERGWGAPAEPGWNASAEPGPPGAAERGWGAPAEPGWDASAEPGPPGAAERGWGAPAEPGWDASAEPGPPGAAERGWGAPAEPGWDATAAPGPPGAAERGWGAPAEPGWGASAERGRTARTEPGRPARTDQGFPFFAEPEAAAGAGAASGYDPRLPPPGPPGQPGRHSLPPAPVPPGRTHRRRAMNWAALLALVLLAGIGYLAYHLFAGSSRVASSAHSAPARPPTSQAAVPSSPAPTPTPTQSPSPKPAHPARPLAPVGAQALGVSGTGDDPANAHLAIDGNPGTAWRTDWYTTAAFGNLYAGTGLLVDMGRPVTITAARIRFGPAHGGSFQLRVGRHPSLASLRPVAHGVSAGLAQPHIASPARGRYVLIWFTSLPVDPTGQYRASVYDVHLRGR